MKPFVAFILAVTYLVASTGTTMHLHFCMGKLANWSLLNTEEKGTCDECGMEYTPGGCCKNEQKWLKIENDQNAPNLSVKFAPLQVASPVHSTDYDLDIVFPKCFATHAQSHAPPRYSDVAVYKRNCVFRI